jgi:hypothetical protein
MQTASPVGPNLSDIADEQERVVAAVHAEFSTARTERLARDYEWWVEWQWYHGNTRVHLEKTAHGTGKIFETSYANSHRRARPINFIGRAVDLTVAKHQRARPVFDVRPATNDTNDRLAARAARSLVRHIWNQNNLTSRRRDMLLDRVITGNGFVKVYFDDMLPPLVDDLRDCSMCNGMGQIPEPEEWVYASTMMQAQGLEPPVWESKCPQCQGAGQLNFGKMTLGDVAVRPVPPWEIWPLRGARRIEDGYFHSYRMTKEQAAASYQIPIEELKSVVEMREGESQFAKFARSNIIMSEREDDRVWVIEKWLPPAPRTLEPRVVVVVGNKVAWPTPQSGVPLSSYGAPIREAYGRVPMFHFRLRPCAEEFWSSGYTLDMISANDFVNRARANFHRHMHTMAFTKWMVERGTVDKDALTNDVGEVVEYMGAEPPRQQSPATMPEFYIRLAQAEEENIPKLAGLQDIDQGKAPPNIEAFQALHFLAEQSETIHGPVLLEDEENWRMVARASLICAVTNYKPGQKRMLRVGGAESRIEVDALLRSSMTDNLDVVCEIGSALAHSQALRQEQVFRSIELGLLTPVEARRLMEWGIMIGEDGDDHRVQESVAVAEQYAIASGGQHLVLPTVHDHEIHLRMHRKAALEAQLEGNFELAGALEMAAAEHLSFLQPPAPAPMPGAPPAEPGMEQMPAQ